MEKADKIVYYAGVIGLFVASFSFGWHKINCTRKNG